MKIFKNIDQNDKCYFLYYGIYIIYLNFFRNWQSKFGFAKLLKIENFSK